MVWSIIGGNYRKMGKVFSLILLMAVCAINVEAQTDSAITSSDSVMKMPEVLPEFPGGPAALIQYLNKVTFPPFARENDIESTVYIEFIVEKDGTVGDVKVARSSGHKIQDDAAIEHVKAMPQWKPGYQDGLPVRVPYVVPIKFKLS